MNKEHTEIYYDHYKDTFENIIFEKKRREKYFFAMLFVTLFIFLSIYIPELVDSIINDIIKDQASISTKISFNWIKSLFIFSFIWISFSYYQIVLNIERLYNYIHKMEENLSKRMGHLSINRESSNYLDKYPIVLSIIHIVYNFVIPLAIICLFSSRWYIDNYCSISTWSVGNYIDTCSEAIIIITAIFFFFRMNIKQLVDKLIKSTRK